MPPRVALNAYYAWRVDGMEPKQRKEFDSLLNGWDEANQAADRDLFARINDGGGEG